MGIVLSRAEVVKGLEPVTHFKVDEVRAIQVKFEEICPIPALWERAFHELLGCFSSVEACTKAFTVLDTDGNGFVDARETLGALAILSKGHLTERMTLLFDIFDLNKEKEMTFDECFMMLRRTMGGLRKMVGIHAPPEKVIHNMTKQVWRSAKKHRDARILPDDWYNWWSNDASCRNGLKMFVWRPEYQRGLPTPDWFVNVDYTKGKAEADTAAQRGSLLVPGDSRPTSVQRNLSTNRKPRRTSSFCATVDQEGEVSKPVQDSDLPQKQGSTTLAVPGAPPLSVAGTGSLPGSPSTARRRATSPSGQDFFKSPGSRSSLLGIPS